MCGQFAEASPLLLERGFRGWNSDHLAWQQAPLLTEPSFRPVSGLLDVRQVVLLQAWINKTFQLVTKNAGFFDPLIKRTIHQIQFQTVLNPFCILRI